MSAPPASRPAASAPALEDEREIDFGRLGRSLVARWWLILAAVAVGAVVGYLTSLGGGDVYIARTTIYLGQPLSPTGNAQIQSLATNPATVSEIVGSEDVVARVADELGVSPRALRRGTTTRQITGSGAAATRTTSNPLVQISVRGTWSGDTTAQAANLLAEEVVREVSGYVDSKVESLERRRDAENREIEAIDRQIAQLDSGSPSGVTSGERLVLASLAEQRRGELIEDRTTTEQLITLANTVERGKQVTEAGSGAELEDGDARRRAHRSPRRDRAGPALGAGRGTPARCTARVARTAHKPEPVPII
jgi:capsular polysaccharide biosynthesis protein